MLFMKILSRNVAESHVILVGFLIRDHPFKTSAKKVTFLTPPLKTSALHGRKSYNVKFSQNNFDYTSSMHNTYITAHRNTNFKPDHLHLINTTKSCAFNRCWITTRVLISDSKFRKLSLKLSEIFFPQISEIKIWHFPFFFQIF